MAFRYLAIYGFIAFFSLFISATTVYPGGSKLYPSNKGYDWTKNYICDLSRSKSFNGEKNIAKVLACGAIGFLCCSIAVAIINFSATNISNLVAKLTLQISVILSMLSAMLLYTDLHNLIILPVLLLSMITLSILLYHLVRMGELPIVFSGLFCLMLLLLNYYIFLFNVIIVILPIFQKITLMVFIIWILKINFLKVKRFKTVL